MTTLLGCNWYVLHDPHSYLPLAVVPGRPGIGIVDRPVRPGTSGAHSVPMRRNGSGQQGLHA